MTSQLRRHVRRHRSTRAAVLGIVVMVAACILALAEYVVSHVVVFVPTAAAAVIVAYLLGCRRQTRAHVMSSSLGRERRVVQGQVVSEDAGRVEQLQAELSRVRRQVADLEDAAGRPIGAITETYRHLQRQYGEAAMGKTGRRP